MISSKKAVLLFALLFNSTQSYSTACSYHPLSSISAATILSYTPSALKPLVIAGMSLGAGIESTQPRPEMHFKQKISRAIYLGSLIFQANKSSTLDAVTFFDCQTSIAGRTLTRLGTLAATLALYFVGQNGIDGTLNTLTTYFDSLAARFGFAQNN